MASYVCCSSKSADAATLQQWIQRVITLLRRYMCIVNAYIADFHTHQHSSMLQSSWWTVLQQCEPDESLYLLDTNHWKGRKVWPLSLLAFVHATKSLSLPTKPVNINDGSVLQIVKQLCEDKPTGTHSSNDYCVSGEPKASIIKDGQMMDFNHCYRKHVKPKKQHEISHLGSVINDVCTHCDCRNVIDLGAGQGHLSRVLSYGFGLNVTTVEATDFHAPKAEKFDKEVKYNIDSGKILTKKKRRKALEQNSTTPIPSEPANQPNHIVGWVTPNSSVHDLLNTVDGKDGDFTLAGLHACGDLSTTLLRVFTNGPDAASMSCAESTSCGPSVCSVISVACCYMKLFTNTNSDDHEKCDYGYPMSAFVGNQDGHELSFEAREMACHFIEQYKQKLKDNDHSLKIQANRAALQEVLVENSPQHQNGLVKLSLKGTQNMDAQQYITAAFEKLSIKSPPTVKQRAMVEQRVENPNGLVAFCALRLSMAPVVETLILLDRMLYLAENGHSSALVPVFNPEISPRNIALISVKTARNK